MIDSEGTIQGGEGGVTAGDVALLFEDADNELKNLQSFIAKLKFDFHKLRAKLTQLQEQLEFHYGSVPETATPVPQMGESNGGERGGGASGSNLRQQQSTAVASRSTKARVKAPPSPAKKEKE